MEQDKLKSHRKAESRGSDSFYAWLETNCDHAVSHEEVRKITSSIKEPIRKIIKQHE